MPRPADDRSGHAATCSAPTAAAPAPVDAGPAVPGPTDSGPDATGSAATGSSATGSTPGGDGVRVERRGPALWIIIDRHERRNAVNASVIRAIGRGIAQANADRTVRAVVLTGAGERAFCAGADLQTTSGAAFAVDFADPHHYFVELLRQVQDCPVPLVARVNGDVMAGGMGLLCACDMAVAVAGSRYGTPEVNVGIAPMMITPYLLRVMPHRKLMELMITGEPIDAELALAAGLLNYVVPRAELDAKVDWLIARIAGKSPTAVRLAKQGYSAMRDMSLRDGLEYAQVMVPVMASTPDAAEGMAAFREKRKPRWSGS